MRESVIEKYFVDEIKKAGGRADKYKSPNRRSVPDRFCMFDWPIVFFAELKATGEAPDEGQLREHKRLRDAGFPVLVPDSKDAVDNIIWVVKCTEPFVHLLELSKKYAAKF